MTGVEPTERDSRANPLELRLNRGLTRLEVCRACDVSHQTLVRAESGERPAAPQAKRIADFYGRRVTDLWPIEEVAA